MGVPQQGTGEPQRCEGREAQRRKDWRPGLRSRGRRREALPRPEPPDPHAVGGLVSPWPLVTELPSTRGTPRKAEQRLPLPPLRPERRPTTCTASKTGGDPGTSSPNHCMQSAPILARTAAWAPYTSLPGRHPAMARRPAGRLSRQVWALGAPANPVTTCSGVWGRGGRGGRLLFPTQCHLLVLPCPGQGWGGRLGRVVGSWVARPGLSRGHSPEGFWR